MPIHKNPDGTWLWGNQKKYKSKKDAVRQMKAIYANGYKEMKKISNLNKLKLLSLGKYVYTYLPKMNTALSLGILSTAKSPSGWLKYKLRSGKTTKLLVLLYLNSLLPNRAYAFSAFSSPIPADAHKDFLLFKKSKLLYAVAIAKLLRDKRILSMYRTSDKGKATSKVSLILKIDWSNRKPGKFLFSKVPHYIIAVKDGVVPKEYIKKYTRRLELYKSLQAEK